VNALVRQLGDESHKEREVAENALAEYDRSILPILTKLKRSKDPEVRLRASRIIAKLLADPAKAPNHYLAVLREKAPRTLVTAWEAQNMLGSEFDKYESTVGGLEPHAQPFTATADKVVAVQIRAGVQADGSWLSVAIHDDDDGKPGKSVLCRSSVYFESWHSHAHARQYLPVDLPDIDVLVGSTYWLVLRANVGAIGVGTAPASGAKLHHLWRERWRPYRHSRMTHRIIVKMPESPPGMRKATAEEIQAIIPVKRRLSSHRTSPVKSTGNQRGQALDEESEI